MRNNRIYGRLATEGIEAGAVAPGEETPVEPTEAGADSLEADLVEVNNDIVDLNADEATVDEAADVAEELEVAAEALTEIAANGGLDRNGARVLNMYRASLNKRLGLPAGHKTLSIESFGGTAGRAGQTSLAAEGIAEQAKDLWGKIVEMFRTALNAIAGVWNRIFDGATRMKARAEKVAKQAGEAKGEPAAKTFENQKLADNLHINGTVNVVGAADAINKEASVLAAIAKHSTAFAGQATQAITAGGADAVASVLKSARESISGFTKVADPATVGAGAPGDGLELWKSEPLPGNKAIIATMPGEGAKPDAIGKSGYKIGTYDASKKVADKLQMAVLSAADAGNVAKKIGDAATLLISYKKYQTEAEAAAKKVIDLAEAKAKEAAPKEGESTEGKISGVDARALAKGAMSAVVNAAPPIAAAILNAGSYALQYAEQSLKQYGAKKAAPAAAPAAA